jgi:ubiquinol-cytochrome c reductase cytochrome b subunit
LTGRWSAFAHTASWLADRLGLPPRWLETLDKPLPRGVGWLNTLGSTLLLFLIVQVVTGIALAFYYAPSTAEAHESLTYIRERVLFGKLLHGLHHYGASAVVLVLLFHLLRVFWHGAYKPPRELTWIVGVLLLGLVMGFAFTGYLLPWDQKAYWATVVSAEIVASMPLIGPPLRRVLLGGEDVGPATLTHFFALHTLLFPLLLYTLIGAHLLFVWRKGPTPPGQAVGEAGRQGGRFLTHQLLKDAVAMGVAFALLFALAWLRPAGLEPRADPADDFYTPRPDWYFLWLFELLKYLPGALKSVAGVGVPMGALIVLLSLPWLDRCGERRAGARRAVLGWGVSALVALTTLTALGVADRPHNISPADNPLRAATAEMLERGARIYREQGCAGCHRLAGEGGESGPALDQVGRRRKYDVDGTIRHIQDPAEIVPGSTMPPYKHVPEAYLRDLIAYLFQDRFNGSDGAAPGGE